MSEDNTAIKVENVFKTFKIPIEAHNGLKQKLINQIKGRKGYREFTPLKGISFEIKKGEFFGIVGRNGSGKSTLLKTIAGIYHPEKGGVTVNGSLVPFIELGVGFNPDLTGRENVFLNGALLGFSHGEMEGMYDEIVDFAELHDFMEERLKNYSSGMQVRLAFSIAIRAKGDILLLDEVLAVGDANFQRKCIEYFNQLKNDRKTVILVSHDMESVKNFCSRALLLEDGKIRVVGKPNEVASQYTLDNVSSTGKKSKELSAKSSERLGSQVSKLNIVPQSPLLLSNAENFVFDIEYKLNNDIEIDIGISILSRNVALIEHNTKKIKISSTKGKVHHITYKMPLGSLNSGVYDISVAVFEKRNFTPIAFNTDACSFVVENRTEEINGLLAGRGDWI